MVSPLLYPSKVPTLVDVLLATNPHHAPNQSHAILALTQLLLPPLAILVRDSKDKASQEDRPNSQVPREEVLMPSLLQRALDLRLKLVLRTLSSQTSTPSLIRLRFPRLSAVDPTKSRTARLPRETSRSMETSVLRRLTMIAPRARTLPRRREVVLLRPDQELRLPTTFAPRPTSHALALPAPLAASQSHAAADNFELTTLLR